MYIYLKKQEKETKKLKNRGNKKIREQMKQRKTKNDHK